jgi:hypothetical protein
MISTKEAHPPVKTLVVVRTGASKVEITSPAKRGNWICKSLTDGSRSRQFGIGTRALGAVKRMNRTNEVLLRIDGNAMCSLCHVRGISRSPENLIFVLSAGFPLDSFLTAHAGRAPSSEVHSF